MRGLWGTSTKGLEGWWVETMIDSESLHSVNGNIAIYGSGLHWREEFRKKVGGISQAWNGAVMDLPASHTHIAPYDPISASFVFARMSVKNKNISDDLCKYLSIKNAPQETPVQAPFLDFLCFSMSNTFQLAVNHCTQTTGSFLM